MECRTGRTASLVPCGRLKTTRRVQTRFISTANRWAVELEDRGVIVPDIRQLFVGHGVTAREDRWHWREFMIEPNAEGARQIAALWLRTLQLAKEKPSRVEVEQLS